MKIRRIYSDFFEINVDIEGILMAISSIRNCPLYTNLPEVGAVALGGLAHRLPQPLETLLVLLEPCGERALDLGLRIRGAGGRVPGSAQRLLDEAVESCAGGTVDGAGGVFSAAASCRRGGW